MINMFSTKCLELVKAQQTKSEFKPNKEYNNHLLQVHQKLMSQNTGSRSVCPYNLKDTNSNKYYGPLDCKKCSSCKGNLLYNIWFINLQIEGCFDVLNDKQQGVEFKEACFFHLKDYRQELKQALLKAHNLGL